MANPKNRQAVEDALARSSSGTGRDLRPSRSRRSPRRDDEAERHEGPREILTRKCPTCGGDGVVISEQSACDRSRAQASCTLRGLARAGLPHRGERHGRSRLIGSGASRLRRSKRTQALLPRARRRPSRSLPRVEQEAGDGCADAPCRGRPSSCSRGGRTSRSAGCGRKSDGSTIRRRGCGAPRGKKGRRRCSGLPTPLTRRRQTARTAPRRSRPRARPRSRRADLRRRRKEPKPARSGPSATRDENR